MTYIRTLTWRHWIGVVLIAVVAFSATYYQVLSAACYPGTVQGRACYRGYFTNIDDRGGDFVLPVIKNGQAIPRSDVNSADSLYALIRAAYDSNNAQRKTGAAFIYNTMMDNNAPGVGRTVSNAQWNDLHQRLKALDDAGKIDWGGNVSASINSYWQGTDGGFTPDGSTNDDAFYSNYKNEAGIRIRDYNNNVVYEILRRCANPVGSSGGLPQTQNYTLTPHINSVSPTQVETGSKVSVTGSVDNQGQVNSSATQWEITQIIVQPGKKAPYEDEPAGTQSPTAPCQSNGGAASGDYFATSDASCKNIAKGSGVFNLGTPAQNLKPAANNVDVGDLPVGARICFALSVQPRSNTDTQWAHSKPICTVVGKKPKVQIWGGDISVRGKIETSTSVKDDGSGVKTFGSWVEYGAFSVGTNSRFASGSGLNNQSLNEQAAWSKFTFANKDQTGQTDVFGNYTTLPNFRPLPTIAAYFAATRNQQPIGAASVDLASLVFDTGGVVQARTATNLTITGGDIPVGKSVVIIASGTVTIDGNITYTDASLGAVRDIPQVVIIARSINIRDNVSRVDSWLVASDTINTCYNTTGSLTSGKCNILLEVNGPVITNRLVLNRTAGSDTGAQSGDPAERFNLRPDAFLWGQLQAQGNSKAQTVHLVELPPRF